MGGPGSGSWYRWDKKTYAEEMKRIDIRYLRKQGMLTPGNIGSLSWTTNGEPSGDIRYQMHSDRIVLIYRYRINNGDWEHVNDTVWFDETPCNFGGSRKWFICPSCGDRVGRLYGPGKYFRCRNCYQISYSSQSEGRLDRLCRKAKKIRHRLDIDSEWWEPDCLSDPIFMKPKGMRWKTFERLKRTENQLQENIERLMIRQFGRGWY